MNPSKLILKLAAVTVISFALSFAFARLAGVGPGDGYSQLALRYAQALRPTTLVQVRKQYPIEGIRELRVDLISTDLEINLTDEPQITADLEGHFPVPEAEPERALKSKVAGQILHLKTEEQGEDESDESLGWLRLDLENGERILRLSVPRSVEGLVIKTVSGDFRVENAKLKKVDVQTVSGDLLLEGLDSESIDLKTVSGDLRLTGAVNEIKYATVSGDASLELTRPSPRLQLNTTSGDIRLNFKNDPDLEVSFTSMSGEIRVSDAIPGGGVTGSRATFRLGAGTGRIQAQTISGDLDLTRD